MLGKEIPELMKMLVKEKREEGLELKGMSNRELPKDSYVSFKDDDGYVSFMFILMFVFVVLFQMWFSHRCEIGILWSCDHIWFQVPNPFGQDAGRGAMEGVGEEEWVVTKDKERDINIHFFIILKKETSDWSHIRIGATLISSGTVLTNDEPFRFAKFRDAELV